MTGSLSAKHAVCATDAEVYRCENAIRKVSGILSGLWPEQAVFDGIVGMFLRRKVVTARLLKISPKGCHVVGDTNA